MSEAKDDPTKDPKHGYWHGSAAGAVAEWARRAEVAEAKVLLAMKALERIEEFCTAAGWHKPAGIAAAALRGIR